MKSAISPLFQLGICTVGYLYATSSSTFAQVTPDGTVNTQVNQNGNVAEITQGETRGGNLFHSFQDFSVTTGNEAFFNNANDISNIFSRVTGGNISDINGLIRANGSANLFLINPAGIVFGEGARLDIGGSFYGSTSSSILFEDGEFSAADLDNAPLLTVNAPIGLGFRDNPGDIVNRSTVQNDAGEFVGLEVAVGKNLRLIGGDLNFEAGEATAKDGNIELGGLSAAGIVSLNEDGSLSFPENVTQADINLSNAADVSVKGTGRGNIVINARNLNLETGEFGESQIRAGITADSANVDFRAGNITINATDNLTIDRSSISNEVDFEAVGNGGDVTIASNSLTITNGGQVSASTFGQGNAGSVIVEAQSVDLTAGGTIESITTDTGNAGLLAIEARSIEITGNDPISNRSSGLFSSVGLFDAGIAGGTGNGGNLVLETDSLRVTNGGRISADIFGTSTEAKAGSIRVTANSIDIIGFNPNNQSLSGIFAAVAPSSSGSAGDVVIETETLLLDDGGFISASTFGEGDAASLTIRAKSIEVTGLSASNVPSRLRANVDFFGDSRSSGNGGNLTIETETLRVTDGAEISANTFADGNAGSIDITATDNISIDGEGLDGFPSAVISRVGSGAVGDAGGITLTTGSLFVTNGAEIDASSFGEGNAGSITINANDAVTFDGIRANGIPSSAFSSVFPGAVGDAGGVTIDANSLTLTNGGAVAASTFGSGNAGDVTINARESVVINGVIDNNRSGLSANTLIGSGNGGDVNVFTNQLTIDNGGIIEAGNFDSFGILEPGTGSPGNITLETNSLRLSNQARIEAVTQSINGDNANIDLQITEDLVLSNDALISARAFQQARGGNLDVNARFIIAFRDGNNDIIASAQQGNGGNININAESLFGIEERPLNSSTNDINASSEFSLDGNITITTLNIDPLQGTTELPNNVVEANQTTQQACRPSRGSASGSGLNLTGKGGVVPSPGLPLNSLNVTVNGKNDLATVIPAPIETSIGKIQPARGIRVSESGAVTLTAYRTNNAGERLESDFINCERI